MLDNYCLTYVKHVENMKYFNKDQSALSTVILPYNEIIIKWYFELVQNINISKLISIYYYGYSSQTNVELVQL